MRPPSGRIRAQALRLLAGLRAEKFAAKAASAAAADCLRALTLGMCAADPEEYTCVLTSGATGKLRG